MELVEKIQALHPTISRLLELSGAPGLSLGVLHRGSILHYSHFGRKNVDYATPPDNDSICQYSLIPTRKVSYAHQLFQIILLRW
jgi:hypothetical protein